MIQKGEIIKIVSVIKTINNNELIILIKKKVVSPTQLALIASDVTVSDEFFFKSERS